MAKLINGKEISSNIRIGLKKQVEELRSKGITPGLAVVLVGDDPASHTYVNNKEKACAEVGVRSFIYRLPKETGEEELGELIHTLNHDRNVHGLLVQLPLPKHLNERKILAMIDYRKDVDGFSEINAGGLFRGTEGLFSCTPLGIIELIKSTGVPIAGKHAVVIGRSNIVGKPVAMMLLQNDATVTICHSKTVDLPDVARQADILVAAIGRPKFVTADMVKEGAIVIDVGTTRVDGKLTGDVDFDGVSQKASFITPVPGGVGPMTITMLLHNTILAAGG